MDQLSGILLSEDIPLRDTHTIRTRCIALENLMLRDVANRLIQVHAIIDRLLVQDHPDMISPEFTATTMLSQLDDRLTGFEGNMRHVLERQLKESISTIVTQFSAELVRCMTEFQQQTSSNSSGTNDLIMEKMQVLSQENAELKRQIAILNQKMDQVSVRETMRNTHDPFSDDLNNF